MLLTILLLNLVTHLTNAGGMPQVGLEGLENLVEKMVESRLRDVERKIQDGKEKLESRLEELEMKLKDEKQTRAKEREELEERNKELERRVDELEERMKEELGKGKMELEASRSKMRMEKEEEVATNYYNATNALTKPSLRDLPIVLISAWRESPLKSPQTVTFESFLANYKNGERLGGGDGELDLESGIFTCITHGYYKVSFSAYGVVGPGHSPQWMFLYRNGEQVPESVWVCWKDGAVNFHTGFIGSRILVSSHFDNGYVCKNSPQNKISPDSPPGCRKHSGAENDSGHLYQFYHSQH